jgi:hypothetical protein
VWVTMVMYDEDAFNRATHTEVLIIVLETLKTSGDRWIFFRLCLFGTDSRMGRSGGVNSYRGRKEKTTDTHLKVKLESG